MSRHVSMIRNFYLSDVITLANGGRGARALFLARAHMGGAGTDRLYNDDFLPAADSPA